MTRYLLDTNHLSAYVDGKANLCERVELAIQMGHRFGICLPVLCEYRAGIGLGRRFRQNLARLDSALTFLRMWPADEYTAVEYADLEKQLRAKGREMSQFDQMIAALARQHELTLLTADRDFQGVGRLWIENWL